MRQLENFKNYSITEDGRVFNNIHNRELRPYLLVASGYPAVTLRHPNGNRRPTTVHRLVASTFIPNPLNLPQVNHKDGDKTNNHVSNLEWCDNSHNSQHAYDKGLTPKGESRYNNVNPVESIHHVCQLLEEGIVSNKKISEITGVSPKSVGQIKARKQWRDISNCYNF